MGDGEKLVDSVFSTCVEVFPQGADTGRHVRSFLHVRGGVSIAG